MNSAAILTLIVGALALLFGAWGRFSEDGRTRYDEMAGMIPYAAWYAGLGMLSLSLVLWIVIWMRR